MVRYNEENNSIEFTQSLSWEFTLKPIWDSVYEDLLDNKDDIDEEDLADLQSDIEDGSLPAKLTEALADYYEEDEYYLDNISFSDEDIEEKIYKFLDWEYAINF